MSEELDLLSILVYDGISDTTDEELARYGRDGAVHGQVLERIRPEPSDDYYQCQCLLEAIIECTDTWKNEHTSSSPSGLAFRLISDGDMEFNPA